MILAQLWPVLSFIGGVLLLAASIANLIHWRRRSRWQKCHGTVREIKTIKDVDGTRYCPIIIGKHLSKPFKITGNSRGREPEVGQKVVIFHDPKTKSYFEYDRMLTAMNIVIPILLSITLFYFTWRLTRPDQP